jgi:hypothetical protein
MLEQGMITEEQANEIRAFWNEINGFAESIDLTTREILRQIISFSEYLKQNPSGTFEEYLEQQSGLNIDASGFSKYLKNFITNNPNSSWLVTDADGNVLDNEGNIYHVDDPSSLKSGMAYTTSSDGSRVLVNSSDIARSYFHAGDDGTLDQMKERRNQQSQSHNGKTPTSGSSASSKSIDDKVNDRLKERGINPDSPVAKAMRENPSHFGIYDSGGILSGLGGIKASARDEIVIPPDLAEFMLRPSANKTFQSRVSELAYLYGAKPIPGTLNNRSSNDHYGDTYTFGNVTLTEDKARTTTVYELAQMSRSLGIYRNG